MIQALHQFDMTDDEVKSARKAGRLAQAHLGGAKLAEAIQIGENLLVGRRVAMKSVGLDPTSNRPPTGRHYAEAFRQWKDLFRFPTGKQAENFYDAALVVAQHRSIADAIIAGLDQKQRADMGAFGLAKRVRSKLNEFEGEAAKPRRPSPSRLSDLEAEMVGRLQDIEERITGVDPLLSWHAHPVATAQAMFQRDRAAARQIMEALIEQFAATGAPPAERQGG
jgi:hypothetical protein